MKRPSPLGWRSTRSHWARGVSLDPRHREKRRGPGLDPSNRSRFGRACSDGNGGASPEAIGFQTHFGFERGAGAFASSRFLDRVSTSKQRVASFDAIRLRGDTKWEKRLGLTALAARHHVSPCLFTLVRRKSTRPATGRYKPRGGEGERGLVVSKAAARGETAAFEPTVFDVWTAWS